MRLRRIRLSGFKSFVDPTTVHLPDDLIAVVGPNGCGKSNIIDAVRWVMGEASARYLRGGTMADVVFTGSNTRKPVSQASVELVFDNSDGRIGGRFASFAEVAVRREVTRDAQSTYYLNGVRCRRRDVTDLFLGTGVSPRSYAIIEQGMISRVIEAKPEELREFLEEAAGISRYKERRRETENRIRHTQENLDRLTDLREELGRRLTHLKRQATMAEKYKVLRGEESQVSRELKALRWAALDQQCAVERTRMGEQETRLEGARARFSETATGLDRKRSEHNEANEAFNAGYRQVLEAGAEIARAEESIQAIRQRGQQLVADEERERARASQWQAQLDGERVRVAEAEQELADIGPRLVAARTESEEALQVFQSADEAMHAWQAQYESISDRAAEPVRIQHTEQVRVEQLEANIRGAEQRFEQVRQGSQALDMDRDRAVLEEALEAQAAADASLAQLEVELAGRRDALRDARARRDALTERIHAVRDAFQTARGRLASLEALQQQALGKQDADVGAWAERAGVDACPRFAEVLDVDAGWERAVESILGSHLQGLCVDDLSRLATSLDAIQGSGLSLLEGAPASTASAAAQERATQLRATPLASHVRGASAHGWLAHGWLEGVFAGPAVEEALARRDQLAPHERFACPDGIQVGANWLYVPDDGNERSGVLERAREIEQLAATVNGLTADLERENATLRAVDEEVEKLDGELGDALQRVAEGHRECAQHEARGRGLRSELERNQARLTTLQSEAAALTEEIATLREALTGASERLAASTSEADRLARERREWEALREDRRRSVEHARDSWQALRDKAHELALRQQALESALATATTNRARLEQELEAIGNRLAELRAESEGQDEPLQSARRALEEQLRGRTELESELAAKRATVEALDAEIRKLEKAREELGQAVEQESDRLQALKLEAQETSVRRRTIEEELARDEVEPIEILRVMLAPQDPSGPSRTADAAESAGSQETDESETDAPESESGDGARDPGPLDFASLPKVDEWVEKLSRIESRISRLGPINLAAIEEFEQQSERKSYLDAQHADLDEALATLQAAMSKIDRETRARFKETYEQVNSGLSRLFPRLFGGGQAELQMTESDLLTTGVTIIARPPGKRNANIQILSGGEKALTAVALVFAIFELNPAPFCLLDEVDAPLDDANVGRFSALVKEMSERVQMVLVTHNKISMEVAHQLIGVTMHEPGVSRLVAVDIDRAVEMAAAS